MKVRSWEPRSDAMNTPVMENSDCQISGDLEEAVCLHQRGNLAEARQIYMRILDYCPENSDALHLLGVIAYQTEEINDAVNLISQAIRLAPDQASYYLNLGNAYRKSNLLGQAVTCFKKAIDLNPDDADANYNLANTLFAQGKFESAIRCFERALAANPPDGCRLYNNMGASHRALGRADDAVNCFKRALQLNSDYAPAYYNLGIEYHLSGGLDKSIQALEQALALNPDHCDAMNLLVHLQQRTCDWEKLHIFAPQLDRLTESALKNQKPTIEAVYTNVLRHADPYLNFSLAQNRSRTIVQQASGIRTNYTYARSAGKIEKITLGYFSADFRNHPIAHLIRGLFKLHDREPFKIYCYSYGKDDGSQYRHQIIRDCDRFVDVQKMSSGDIADRIYEDQVDILIDLMGHTTGNRLEVCALKPAPIQITYLGFPGTTGADFMDYIITDKIVSPAEHTPFYSEKFVYMPHCYQVNNNCQEISEPDRQRKDFGLPENGFVFSSFNQPVKIEPVMFDCWMKILNRVPGSVLWLLWDNRIAEENLRQAAQARDVHPERLIFSQKLSKEEHLARMRLADLALDTRVYNGHTTTSDSLWAGIPVVTLQGSHFASRVSASIVSAIGLQELITHDLKDYENLAVNLALIPDDLMLLQRKLMIHLKSKPLFDTTRFAKNLESAFKEMWRIYLNGKPPRRIDVSELSA